MIARRSRGWLLGGALAAIVLLALLVARGGDDPAKPELPAKKPILAPVTLVLEPPKRAETPKQTELPKRDREPAPKAIELSSRPSAVVLDAKTEARLGRTPMTLELPRGATMELLFVAPGRKSQAFTVDGKLDRLAVDLEKARPKRREKRTIQKPVEGAPPPPAKDRSVQMPEW